MIRNEIANRICKYIEPKKRRFETFICWWAVGKYVQVQYIRNSNIFETILIPWPKNLDPRKGILIVFNLFFIWVTPIYIRHFITFC